MRFNFITSVFTCLTVFLISNNINAQQLYVPIDGLFNSNGVLNIEETDNRYPVPLSSINGSPFLNENFTPGRVSIENEQTKTHLIRYNIHRDVMEVKIAEKEFQELLRKPEISISLNNKTFKYYRSLDGNRILLSGYFEVVEAGSKIDLLIKHKTEYIPEDKVARAYHQPEPAEFKKDEDYYFYIHDSKKLEKIKKIRDKRIIRLLEEYDIDSKELLEDMDLKLRRMEDLEQLVDEINDSIT